MLRWMDRIPTWALITTAALFGMLALLTGAFSTVPW